VDQERDVVVLLQEDKSRDNIEDFPFAQAIAGAVSYFQSKQLFRKSEFGAPRLAKLPILLGICRGLEFSFVRVTITAEVVSCIEKGVPAPKVFLFPVWLYAFVLTF
jgi:hypothetical protein